MIKRSLTPQVATLLAAFEAQLPEIVFEWADKETEARGWIVINSLRGGAAGGGTRMRAGLDRSEVVSLAKTMEVKFTVSGPAIGGAKAGIDFDPADPRRDGVLRRWFRAVVPLLKAYYGTGGDLNVDEVADVIPMTEHHGLWHPQEGVVVGHFTPGQRERIQKVGQLRVGVSKLVEDPRYSPDLVRRYTISDLITGWGVAESVRHFYDIYGGDVGGKRVIIQGWGNVGSAAAYYLARRGAIVVGIIDRAGGLVAPEGLTFEDVWRLFADKRKNLLVSPRMMSYALADEHIWKVGADVFLPCAASHLVGPHHIDRLIEHGLQVIASGANVPFDDDQVFCGPTANRADHCIAAIPDFIANCGMARAFAYLMGNDVEISDHAIFSDVSATIREALCLCHRQSSAPTGITATALAIALGQLVTSPKALI